MKAKAKTQKTIHKLHKFLIDSLLGRRFSMVGFQRLSKRARSDAEQSILVQEEWFLPLQGMKGSTRKSNGKNQIYRPSNSQP